MAVTEPAITHLRVTNPGSFVASQTLESGERMRITPSMLDVDGTEIQDIGYGNDCTVRVSVTNGEVERMIPYQEFTGSGIEADIGLQLVSGHMHLEIENTAAEAEAEYFVTGIEPY